MAGVLREAVGPWGSWFVSIGLIVSVLGAYLAWSLLAAEVLYSAAKSELVPKALARENQNQVPVAAVWLTNILVQTFLILTLFAAVLIWIRHHQNIARLLKGEEPRIGAKKA